MSDSIRINKYRSIYRGPPKGDRALRQKSVNDRAALRFIRTPPEMYSVTNITSTPPRNFHMPVSRFAHPPNIIPEPRWQDRHVKGSALYNQAVVRQIGELSKLIR